MSHDVFICHSSKDRSIANAICSTLEQERIRCWIAPRDVVPGSDYAQSIVEAISGSKLTVLVFTDESNHSTHVRREVERSVSHGIPILPFRVEDVVPSPSLEYFISDAHWLDAVTPPLEQHLHHLAGTVRVLLDREQSTAPGHQPLPAPAGGLPPPGLEPPHVELAPPVPRRRHRAPIWIGAAAVVGLLVVGLIALAGGGGGGVDLAGPTDDAAATTEATGSSALAPTTDVPATAAPDDETIQPADESATTTPVVPVEPVVPATVAPDEPAEPAVPATVAPEEPELRSPVEALGSFAFTEDLVFEWEGGSLSMAGNGVFVAPDQQSCVMTTSMGGLTVESSAIVADGRAWYDDGFGAGLVEVDPDDSMLINMLSGCASSEQMWSGDWSDPPEDGEPVTIDGQDLVAYDVSTMSSSWYSVFGLPPGVTADTMILYVSPDHAWVAGMDASISASAETLRTYFGFPPVGVGGECHMSMSVMVTRPNDPTLTVVGPG